MSVDFTVEARSHAVLCGACGASYDAMAAEWCRCVAKAPSPVCRACGSCVCRQSRAATRDFWLAAPDVLRHARGAEKRRRRAEDPSPAPGAARVLVVDDDEEIRAIAVWALNEMGYAAATASGMREALDLIAADRPAAVLTDALMPGGDGRELCRLIKLRDATVKVIVMTSLYTAQRYVSEAHNTFQADAYMAKPIDFGRLRTTLERLIAEGKPDDAAP